MVADLPGNTLTQMIQLSNMLRSLSAASFHLSNHFDRITGLNPPSTIMTTGGSPSITHPVAPLQSPLIASSSQAQHLTTNSQQGDVILEDVTLDEEVD